MRSLGRAIAAEWRKVFTTRVVWGLLLGFLGWVVLNVVAQVLAGDQTGAGSGVPPLDSPVGLRNVFAASGAAAVFTLVLGILSVTGEFRHGTAANTFMAEPRRGVVIAAKAIAMPCVALLFAVTGIALTIALALPLLAWKDVSVDLSAGQIPHVLVGCLVTVSLYALLGVGFGALIRSQIAALVIALLWMLLAESLLVSFLPAVGKWLPGGAATAMSLGQPIRGGELLTQTQGTALFIAYGVVLALVGAQTTIRRDIT